MDQNQDQNRLKEIQQTDLTESRINQDFLQFLKTHGTTILLVVMSVALVFVLYNRYTDYQETRVNDAFRDLDQNFLPQSLELVAEERAGIRSVPQLAQLRAADLYLREAVARRDVDNQDVELDADSIRDRLHKAQRLYSTVLDSTRNSPERRLLSIQALFGLAAVAESEQRFDEARGHLSQVTELAGDRYPGLGRQAEARLNSLDDLRTMAALPRADAFPLPSQINPLLRDLLDLESLPMPDMSSTGTGE